MSLVPILFFVLMFVGLPIGVTLGLAGVIGLVQIGGQNFLMMAPRRYYQGLDLFTFMAMPFFILAGEIMNRAGITDRLVAFAKLNEVQKYLTLTGHLFAPYVWVMNTKFWNGLSPEEKKVVSSAAKSAIVAGRGIGRVIEASPRGLAALSKTMKVNALTDEQKKAFRDKATPEVTKIINQKFGAESSEMMKAFLDAVKAAE